jgi:carbonic anhydrase
MIFGAGPGELFILRNVANLVPPFQVRTRGGEAVACDLLMLPWIAERVADGRLRLHGAMFDIRFGVLHLLRPAGDFAPV